MKYRLRARSRAATAAVLFLAGGLLIVGSSAPAHADCVRASVWLYRSDQGEDYKYGPRNCVGPDTTFATGHTLSAGHEDDSEDPGTVTGAGFWLGYP